MKSADLAAIAMLAALGSGATGTVSASTNFNRFVAHGAATAGAGSPRRNTGWTNARYQRAARKRRNQQLNRRAHRG